MLVVYANVFRLEDKSMSFSRHLFFFVKRKCMSNPRMYLIFLIYGIYCHFIFFLYLFILCICSEIQQWRLCGSTQKISCGKKKQKQRVSWHRLWPGHQSRKVEILCTLTLSCHQIFGILWTKRFLVKTIMLILWLVIHDTLSSNWERVESLVKLGHQTKNNC